jgi:hypothetical protein
MKWLTLLLVATIIANVFIWWGTDGVFGWIVALAGWMPQLFVSKENHGN